MTLLSVSISLSGWSLCGAGLCHFLRQYHTWEQLCAGRDVHCSPGSLSIAGCCFWRPILM